MAEGKSVEYMAVVRLGADCRGEELAKRVRFVQGKLTEFAKGDSQLAFTSDDARVLGVLFCTSVPKAVIKAELDKGTTNADSFLVFEVGDIVGEKGFGRPATWLQRRAAARRDQSS